MKRFLEIIRVNTLSQIVGILMLGGLFGVLSNWFVWAYPAMVVCAIIFAFYVVVFVIVGFVNFIKALFK